MTFSEKKNFYSEPIFNETLPKNKKTKIVSVKVLKNKFNAIKENNALINCNTEVNNENNIITKENEPILKRPNIYNYKTAKTKCRHRKLISS